MKLSIRRGLLPALLVVVAIAAGPPQAQAHERLTGLFVNLTTDDTWSAAKAIMFAHRRALANDIAPVAIWMNVRAVYLAVEDRPSDVPGSLREQDTSIHDMLTAFMADGGVVIMCQACSRAAGLTMDDYIDGVQMGDWATVSDLMFDPSIRTLTW